MDPIKFQKIRHRRLQKVTALLRLIEIFLFLIILSRSATLLPSVALIKPSGEYFKGLFLSLVSPRFVFVLGNLIVIVLLLNSGQSSSPAEEMSTTSNIKIDLYEEYVESCQRDNYEPVHNTEESNKKRQQNMCVAAENDTQKRIQRSQSEKQMKSRRCEEPRRRILRRSETEKICLKTANMKRVAANECNAVDKMSNEEFRSRVEAFIARQQRLIKQQEEDFTSLNC